MYFTFFRVQTQLQAELFLKVSKEKQAKMCRPTTTPLSLFQIVGIKTQQREPRKGGKENWQDRCQAK